MLRNGIVAKSRSFVLHVLRLPFLIPRQHFLVAEAVGIFLTPNGSYHKIAFLVRDRVAASCGNVDSIGVYSPHRDQSQLR